MDDENEFQTRDFYVAAFWLATGHRILHVNRDDPQRVYFAFTDFVGRDEQLRAFLYGQAVVEPQAFISAIKTLKQLIHSNNG